MTAYTLIGPRLRLEAFGPEHTRDLRTMVHRSAHRLERYMPFAVGQPNPLDDDLLQFTRMRARFLEGDYAFVIRTLDGRAVGACGMHPSVGPLGRAIGYWLDDGAGGQGYATEAASMLCHLAFEREDLDRVELHIEPSNAPSRRVAERLGCTHEATLRRRLPWPDGEPRDIEVHSLFADTWRRSMEITYLDALGRPLSSPG